MEQNHIDNGLQVKAKLIKKKMIQAKTAVLIISRGGFRTAATSKIKRFEIIAESR